MTVDELLDLAREGHALEGVAFEDLDLRGRNLQLLDLRGVMLTRARLEDADLRAARLRLIRAVQQVIHNGLTALAVSAPETM